MAGTVLAPAATGPARAALNGGATAWLVGGRRSLMFTDGVTLEAAACRSAQAPEGQYAEGHGLLVLLRVSCSLGAYAH